MQPTLMQAPEKPVSDPPGSDKPGSDKPSDPPATGGEDESRKGPIDPPTGAPPVTFDAG